MLQECDSRELSRWQEKLASEIEQEQAADLRFGMLLSLLANLHRKAGAAPFKPSDWFHSLRESTPQRLSPEQWNERARAWVRERGGRILEK